MRKCNFLVWSVAAALLVNMRSEGQAGANTLERLRNSSSFDFVRRDGVCVRGVVSKTDAAGITVTSSKKAEISLRKDDLLQVSQGNALLYSARSSWSDVAVSAGHVYPHEAFVLKLQNGKTVKGKPRQVNPDGITLKHAFSTTLYRKAEVVSVDYLRDKPPTQVFTSTLEESPLLLLLYPEFYYRAAGLEGKVKVRLYDATKPEDNSPVACGI